MLTVEKLAMLITLWFVGTINLLYASLIDSKWPLITSLACFAIVIFEGIHYRDKHRWCIECLMKDEGICPRCLGMKGELCPQCLLEMEDAFGDMIDEQAEQAEEHYQEFPDHDDVKCPCCGEWVASDFIIKESGICKECDGREWS